MKEQGYDHFAVFISTHGEEVREKDHYIHKLCFYDGDESTEEILFKPLDKQLRKVKKLVIIQVYLPVNKLICNCCTCICMFIYLEKFDFYFIIILCNLELFMLYNYF